MFNQFKELNSSNYRAWKSFDETHEVEREQIIIETTLDKVNYRNIISRFINRDYDETQDLITSRIFFIHPEKHMYFLYFDSQVYIGSQHVHKLIPYFNKYYRHISTRNKTEFKQLIL